MSFCLDLICTKDPMYRKFWFMPAQYMLGYEEWPGNCKLSCGACSPPAHVRNRFLSERSSAALLAAAETVGGLPFHVQNLVVSARTPAFKSQLEVWAALCSAHSSAIRSWWPERQLQCLQCRRWSGSCAPARGPASARSRACCSGRSPTCALLRVVAGRTPSTSTGRGCACPPPGMLALGIVGSLTCDEFQVSRSSAMHLPANMVLLILTTGHQSAHVPRLLQWSIRLLAIGC